MKSPTEILTDEHKNILRVVDILEEECNALESGKALDRDFFKKAVDFIRNYADKFHHAKEEDILFKQLCKDSVSEKLHCNPIDQMLYEHNIGRDFVKLILDGIKGDNEGKVIRGATGYIQLIREHIFKEDKILYPMADGVLDSKSQKSMKEKFDKAEKSMNKEKYLLIMNEFEKRGKKK